MGCRLMLVSVLVQITEIVLVLVLEAFRLNLLVNIASANKLQHKVTLGEGGGYRLGFDVLCSL